MDCVVFNDRLDALLDGTLLVNQQADTEAHRATCRRCDELYRLMHGDGSGPADVARPAGQVGHFDVAAPSGLAESILARTSGSPCAPAQARLGDLVDRGLDRQDPVTTQVPAHVVDHEPHQETDQDVDLALVDGHVQHCPECAAVARALVRLRDDLPTFAELSPRASLLREVLVRTSSQPSREAGLWEQLRDAGQRLLERPRIAWEVGYVATLVAWLVFGASWSPLRATPVQALTLIQQGASDPQAASVSAMAALSRLSERARGVALGDEVASDDATGILAGLSAYSRRAAHAAPDLGEHWRRFTAAVLDRDLFSGVDALRALSRDAGAMLRRLVSTTTDSGALPDQRSTS
jgi:predicted anti-sigma-YlaC factor YlaD